MLTMKIFTAILTNSNSRQRVAITMLWLRNSGMSYRKSKFGNCCLVECFVWEYYDAFTNNKLPDMYLAYVLRW